MPNPADEPTFTMTMFGRPVGSTTRIRELEKRFPPDVASSIRGKLLPEYSTTEAGPAEVLRAVRRMTPGERRELLQLLLDSGRSDWLWMPDGRGGYSRPRAAESGAF